MPYTIDEIQKIVTPIAIAHGVKRVSLFGSYSRGTADRNSDVDILIEKGREMLLFQLSSLRLSLEDALKLPVDMVTPEANDTEFLQNIQKDEVLLYRKQSKRTPATFMFTLMARWMSTPCGQR